MGLGNKDIFTPIKSKQTTQAVLTNPKMEDSQYAYKRQTYFLRSDIEEKIKGYAYWERLKISEVVNLALESFFKDKKVQTRK
jgi:hypothetical protein